MLHHLELVGTALVSVLGVLGIILGPYIMFKADQAKEEYDEHQREKLERLKKLKVTKDYSELF